METAANNTAIRMPKRFNINLHNYTHKGGGTTPTPRLTLPPSVDGGVCTPNIKCLAPDFTGWEKLGLTDYEIKWMRVQGFLPDEIKPDTNILNIPKVIC